MKALGRGTSAIMLAVSLFVIVSPAKAQTREGEHVVTRDDLNQAATQLAEKRQANEHALLRLFSSPTGRQALQSARVDYAKVSRAVGQLSDEDLARLSDRSRRAEQDFAAGLISAKHLAELILILVVIIVIIVLV